MGIHGGQCSTSGVGLGAWGLRRWGSGAMARAAFSFTGRAVCAAEEPSFALFGPQAFTSEGVAGKQCNRWLLPGSEPGKPGTHEHSQTESRNRATAESTDQSALSSRSRWISRSYASITWWWRKSPMTGEGGWPSRTGRISLRKAVKRCTAVWRSSSGSR